ncbi:MAG: PLP-dependent aminotransferase family protein [Chloroflexota bacterium]
MNFSNRFSDAANRYRPASIRSISNRLTPEAISFAPGMPAFSTFPIEHIKSITAVMLDKYGPHAMQYSITEGFEPLREWVASQMPHAQAHNVQIISGSQQAIGLVGSSFLNVGDKVAISAPTYTGVFSSLAPFGPSYLPIECDAEGMIPESVEAALEQSPKFLYCNPNFMNPTGVDMSLARRQAVADLAVRYDVPILEDDPYGELRFAGHPKPNLYEFAPSHTIYAGTFSKILAPGFRVGWLIAPLEAREILTLAKQAADLQVSTYTQRLIYEALQGGFIEEQIQQVRAYYYQQRNLMLEAMDQYFPPEVHYDAPDGGMFVWCTLPEQLDAGEVLDAALAADVAYVPGTPFYPNGDGKNTLRLSFSLATPEQIDVGLARLGKVLDAAIRGTND